MKNFRLGVVAFRARTKYTCPQVDNCPEKKKPETSPVDDSDAPDLITSPVHSWNPLNIWHDILHKPVTPSSSGWSDFDGGDSDGDGGGD